VLRHLALAATIGLAAGPATALSCLRPDLERSYTWADERPELFVLALGSLVRTGPDAPDGPASDNPQARVSYTFPARFEGRLANAEGFTAERAFDVTVEVDCQSVWCGGDSLSEYGLYFFRRDGEDAHSLEAGLCGGFFFGNPEEHQLIEVLEMMR
jgi:hypothetical protein